MYLKLSHYINWLASTQLLAPVGANLGDLK